jgi:hypothetical protein
MKGIVNWKIFLPMVVVVGLMAWGLSTLSGLNIWWAVGIVAGALFLNGVIAEIEDRMPGGFLTPRKDREQKK